MYRNSQMAVLKTSTDQVKQATENTIMKSLVQSKRIKHRNVIVLLLWCHMPLLTALCPL